jgi:4a-hydroxytetrahydrobiopterin dehydratase
MLLTPAEIEIALHSLPGWTCDGNSLRRTYTFRGFPEAVAFVHGLAGPTEAQGHHPDISVSYNRVTLSLTTHNAGGITAKDFALARVL